MNAPKFKPGDVIQTKYTTELILDIMPINGWYKTFHALAEQYYSITATDNDCSIVTDANQINAIKNKYLAHQLTEIIEK